MTNGSLPRDKTKFLFESSTPENSDPAPTPRVVQSPRTKIKTTCSYTINRVSKFKFRSIWNVTLFGIFIFCPKIQHGFPLKIVDLDFLAVDNFDFMRKIVKNIFREKLVKMLEFCENWIFGQKFDFSNSVMLWWKIRENDGICFVTQSIWRTFVANTYFNSV